jgi:Ca-activated chloride channel family protein
MNIQTDRAKVAAGTPAVRFCTVTITAPPAAPVAGRAERASSNVAFVIDRSGSMAGSKLEMVKRAVDHAFRLLHERDRLALVCYDHEVDVLLGGAPASGEAKTMAGARMRAIDARGNTDLSAGWQAGARELRTIRGSAGSDSVARVLLLSDGLANQGETNPDALAASAETLRNEGITTSTFGVGADFDEHLMSRIATAGGGHFYFIEQAAQIPDLFTSELGEALDIVARDAQLIVRDTGGADTECLNEFPVIRRGDELCIRLGDLTSEQQVTLVLATRIPPQALGDSAGISLRLADRERVLFAQPLDVAWQVVDADADRAQPINRDVIVAAATMLAERAKAEALAKNRAGDFDGARAVLERAIAGIRALGVDVPAVNALIADLEGAGQAFSLPMDAMASKRVLYQSYNIRASRAPSGKANRTPKSS